MAEAKVCVSRLLVPSLPRGWEGCQEPSNVLSASPGKQTGETRLRETARKQDHGPSRECSPRPLLRGCCSLHGAMCPRGPKRQSETGPAPGEAPQ